MLDQEFWRRAILYSALFKRECEKRVFISLAILTSLLIKNPFEKHLDLLSISRKMRTTYYLVQSGICCVTRMCKEDIFCCLLNSKF